MRVKPFAATPKQELDLTRPNPKKLSPNLFSSYCINQKRSFTQTSQRWVNNYALCDDVVVCIITSDINQ